MLNTLFKMVLIANMGACGFIDADMGDGDTINGDLGNGDTIDGDLGVDYINPVDITDEGIIDSKTLDQTDGIRTIMEAGYDYVLFPAGTYRVRNLWVQEGQTLDIRGTVKQVDISSFTVTQNAPQGQDFVYIENATSAEMDSWEALLNEAPTHYNYVCYWDDDYDTEGGSTGQTHKNGWVSRLTGVDKVNKKLTMADNIPVGDGLTTASNAVITVLYNVFEVKALDKVKVHGTGTIDANWRNIPDVNPVWISGEPDHPEYANAGANFIECFNVREGKYFWIKDVTLREGKDNLMMWHMDGKCVVDNVDSYDVHNKNITDIINNDVDYPNHVGLFINCLADGSEFEDGFLGYANADNLTMKNLVAKNCPRNGFTFNRANSDNNYGENLEAYDCGTAIEFNRGGVTDVLTVKNLYIEGGGYHDKVPSYQPAVQIRSQTATECGYVDLTNVGGTMDMHTYCFLVMKAEEINLTWEADCATKYQSIVGNLTPPHAFGYWLRINSQCINIVVDGGGVLEVSDFVYLFNIEAGSTGVVIQNCRFDNYTNLGPIDVGATFTNNYFNGILYANGHP